MDAQFFVDLHSHPSSKAFARSFARSPQGKQSPNPKSLTSSWRKDSPSLFDKIKNYVVTLTNFIQADGESLLRGRVAVTCLSLYPQEKGFFANKLGTGALSDALSALATEYGKQRIDHIQKMKSYWEDLKMETAFLLQMENKPVNVAGKKASYIIARSFDDIAALMRTEELGQTVLAFIPTIEGSHVFDQMMDSNTPPSKYPKGVPDEFMDTLLSRVYELRTGSNGLIPPAFLTLAHHFWNGLCGHSKSLGNMVKCVVDQQNGMEEGITIAGKEVIRALLREEHDQNMHLVRKVPIDVKHMNRRSRLEYFEMLDDEFKEQGIPVLASHAAVTGLPAPGLPPVTPAAKEGLFMSDPINIYDDEILKIEETGGLIGLQLDERRIGSQQALREARGNIRRRDILYSWSKLVWNQIRHIAEVLDMHGRYAWGIQAMGTDFDGIIDPINGYWTAESMDDLDDYLLKHAYNYLKETKYSCPLIMEQNRLISPEEVVERVMTSNALNFLAKYYT